MRHCRLDRPISGKLRRGEAGGLRADIGDRAAVLDARARFLDHVHRAAQIGGKRGIPIAGKRAGIGNRYVEPPDPSSQAATAARSATSSAVPRTIPGETRSAMALSKRRMRSASRPQKNTWHPSAASSSTMAAPIPALPPVTTARLFPAPNRDCSQHSLRLFLLSGHIPTRRNQRLDRQRADCPLPSLRHRFSDRGCLGVPCVHGFHGGNEPALVPEIPQNQTGSVGQPDSPAPQPPAAEKVSRLRGKPNPSKPNHRLSRR